MSYDLDQDVYLTQQIGEMLDNVDQIASGKSLGPENTYGVDLSPLTDLADAGDTSIATLLQQYNDLISSSAQVNGIGILTAPQINDALYLKGVLTNLQGTYQAPINAADEADALTAPLLGPEEPDNETPTESTSSSDAGDDFDFGIPGSTDTGTAAAPTSTPPSTASTAGTTVNNNITNITNTPAASTGDIGETVNNNVSSATSNDTGTPISLGSIETFIQAYVSSLLQSIWQWILDNIINPIKQWWVDLKTGLAYFLFGADIADGSVALPDNILTIPIPDTADEVTEGIELFKEAVDNPVGLFQWLYSVAFKISLFGTLIGSQIAPILRQVENAANAANPQTPLDVGSLVRMQRQQVIAQDAAISLAAETGVSAVDYTNIYNSSFYTPSAAEAALWLARGLITQADYELFSLKAGNTSNTGAYVAAASVRQVDGNSLIQVAGRSAAAAGGLFKQSLTSSPPADIVAQYTTNQVSPNQASVDWLDHFTIPDPQQAVFASFKGLISADDVYNMAIANGYPSEWASIALEVARPTIPNRTITTLYAKKIITAQQAQTYWSKAGYSASDIIVLQAYADSIVEKPPKGPPADLARLALTDAIGLYNDGSITSAQLLTIYEAHGWTADAANYAIEWQNLKNAAVSRKESALDIVDEVDAGTISYEQGVANLNSAAYTPSEVLRYSKMMKNNKASKKKLPTAAQVSTLYSGGYISAADVEAYFTQSGYEDPWLTALITSTTEKTATST